MAKQTPKAPPSSAKIDWKKTLDGYQAKPGVFRTLVIPETQYLMMDGKGDPNNNADFNNAVSVLYHTAYTLKFFSKNDLGKDYTVPPLEGLWYADNMGAYTDGAKEKWNWTLLLMTPEWINEDHFEDTLPHWEAKKPDTNIATLRLESLNEGLAIQTLHIGPFDTEAPTIAELHNTILPTNHYIPNGHHHEIYLSMPRNNPAKWRTILRQPVKPTP